MNTYRVTILDFPPLIVKAPSKMTALTLAREHHRIPSNRSIVGSTAEQIG